MDINFYTKKLLAKGLALLTFIVVVSGCTPTTQVTATWKDPSSTKQYTNIFVVAIFPELATRSALESQLAQYLTVDGVKTTIATEIFPPNVEFKLDSTKQVFLNQMKQLGCDGILTITLMSKEQVVNYVPGTVNYAPMGFYGYYGSVYASPWYNYGYYSPGYYQVDQIYNLATNLYDINTDKLVWTAQTESTDPTSIQDMAPQYAQLVVSKMELASVVPIPIQTGKEKK